MPTQFIEFEAPSGMTLTAKIYTSGSDTVAYTASAVTEQTNRKGVYRATFSNVAANTYQIVATSGTTAVAIWWGYAENSNATYQFGASVAGVWDELMANHSINGSYGSHVVRSANHNQNTVQITGSQHIAADVHAFQPDVIDADALATSAVTEIASGNWSYATRIITGLTAGALSQITTGIYGLGQVAIRAEQADDGTIVLYEDMDYNNIAHPKLNFTVTKDYQAATFIHLIFHYGDDYGVVSMLVTCTATSATNIDVDSFTATFSPPLTYAGCPSVAQLRYSLIASFAGDLELIATGPLFVFETPPAE